MTATALKMESGPESGETLTAGTTPAPATHDWLPRFSTGLMVVVVILIVVAGGGGAAGVWRFATIDTGSMRPVLEPGDVAILRPEPLRKLHVGQIIAFRPPGEPTTTVIHRVATIDRHGGVVVIQTKGDANNARDQWRARLEGSSVWFEAGSVPKIGYLVVWTQVKLVRYALLLGIVALALIMGLRSLWGREPGRVRN